MIQGGLELELGGNDMEYQSRYLNNFIIIFGFLIVVGKPGLGLTADKDVDSKTFDVNFLMN